jgi:transmembrane sensor
VEIPFQESKQVNINEQQYERIAAFLAGELSAQEQAELFAWVEASPENQLLFEEVRMIWEASEVEPLPSEMFFDNQQAWRQLEDSLPPTVHKEARRRSLSFVRIGQVAAAVLLIGLISWWWMQPEAPEMIWASYTTDQVGEEVRLEDGTVVWLNARSEMRVGMNPEVRMVQLSGEAFFDVSREENRPFRIEAQGSRTEVLGTSFNIRAYPGDAEVEVVVESGKVAVKGTLRNEAEPVVLSKGEAVAIETSSGAVKRLDGEVANKLSWHTGLLNFDDTGLGEVGKVAERYFGRSVEFQDSSLKNCHFTGQFDQPTADEFFRALSFTLNLKVIVTDEGYILSGPGCPQE